MSHTIYHMGLDIQGFLKKRSLKGLLRDEGRKLSDREVRDVLIADLRQGHDVFCPCDNRAEDGSCAGHAEEQSRG